MPPPPTPEVVPDLFAGPEGDVQDDAPTIISKAVPQPARLEEAFAGTLRGRILAHFELIEPIGVGGMAAVIRARDLHLDRYVALKILPPEMAHDPENIRRFHQEARAAARLDHENIARVFFCGEDQRLHFIAFEFVEGDNLRVILERRGRLPVPEALHYMLQIATGLAHASARGVVHRDIKPSNIIISPNGRAKLVDMGLARSLEPHHDNALTQSGVTLGTFDYISPEQALEPRDADVRSDLYSLGCTFYHMLTGQPPVPEGTAAKKLHHHQHVPPIDPRQLNPNVPDEVAAILSRMMAKDPKDRYQRAEHLVQHLIQVAQRLGVGTEAPDGVLFVDAPLPGPPHRRPVLLAALALLSLAGLLGLLSLAPTGGANRENDTDTPPKVVTDQPPPRPPQNPGPPEAPDPPGNQPFLVRNRADLVKASEAPDAAETQTIVLKKDLDLEATGAGVVFRGKKVTLEPDPGPKDEHRTLTISFDASADGAPVATGLTIDGGEVTFQDLTIKLKGLPFEERGRLPALRAALCLKGGTLHLRRCTLLVDGLPDLSTSRPDPDVLMAAVAVRGTGEVPPRLDLEECYFQRGQSAVDLRGPAGVAAKNCLFGPHLALFHLRGRNTAKDTRVTLEECSTFLVNGPAFRLDQGAGATLVVRHSVFSCPDTGTGSAGGPEADLIFQTEAGSAPVCYQGTHNVYHNLNAYWVRRTSPEDANPEQFNKLSDFRDEVRRAAKEGFDHDSWSPAGNEKLWAENNPLDPALAPERAFRLNTGLPDLRQGENKDQMIGALRSLGHAMYSRLPPLKPKPEGPLVRNPSIKIVDPTRGTGQGFYKNLDAAISEAEKDDEIQIKSDRPVAVNRLDKPIESLTIKPYQGYHPVLVLNETPEKKAALFRLHDGQLRFEDLEFRLQPNKAAYDFQTIVEVIGNGRCVFVHCLFTLAEADKTPAGKCPSVVRLTDPGEAMKMGGPVERTAPEIVFQDCLVRGQGDLVAVHPSRPLVLELKNTAVALDGSLMTVAGGAKEQPAASPDERPTDQVVQLDHVLAYLTKPVLHIRARGGKGLVPLAVRRAADSLFMAADFKPLIQLDGLDSERQVGQFFSWSNGSNNVYLNFEKMLDSPRSSYDQGVWENGPEGVLDKEPRFGTGKFRPKKALSQLVPDDFRDIKADERGMELQKYGPDLDKLPRGADREKPETVKTDDQEP